MPEMMAEGSTAVPEYGWGIDPTATTMLHTINEHPHFYLLLS